MYTLVWQTNRLLSVRQLRGTLELFPPGSLRTPEEAIAIRCWRCVWLM